MITKKMWVKFNDEGELECFCNNGDKSCPSALEPTCEEYVVKFMKIHRVQQTVSDLSDEVDRAVTVAERTEREIATKLRRFETELQKSIKNIKKI